MKVPIIYDYLRFLFYLNKIKDEFYSNNFENCLKLSWWLINELNKYYYVWYLNWEALMYLQKSSFKISFDKNN